MLRRTRLAVATRPGFPRERLDTVLAELEQPERVRFFELEPTPGRLARPARPPRGGRGRVDEVPPAVAEILAREGLYPRIAGYTGSA